MNDFIELFNEQESLNFSFPGDFDEHLTDNKRVAELMLSAMVKIDEARQKDLLTKTSVEIEYYLSGINSEMTIPYDDILCPVCGNELELYSRHGTRIFSLAIVFMLRYQIIFSGEIILPDIEMIANKLMYQDTRVEYGIRCPNCEIEKNAIELLWLSDNPK